MRIALIYPHQLISEHPSVADADLCLLVEDPLFFTQYSFHVQKLVFHRATMRAYTDDMIRRGRKVEIVSCTELQDSGDVAARVKKLGGRIVEFVDPHDDWLEQRLKSGLARHKIACEMRDDPLVLTPWSVFTAFAGMRRKLFFTEFYVRQRQRLEILLDEQRKPVGGKWSFDPENRKKPPKGTKFPAPYAPQASPLVEEAIRSVARDFPDAPGSVTGYSYPTTRDQALRGLDDFLDRRLARFGEYEDAIQRDEGILFHSVLTPALNVGLLSPREVLDAALERIEEIPLNSLEGFVRQILGWREFIRCVYRHWGRRQRTRNFWGHTAPIPAGFYDGTTGIAPVDTVIRRVLDHAYCHHIERLMVLGNFMLLCEIDPDAVYRWFMELFIDAYDWVMVPNVYAMSQYADGGTITTKPYIGGSSYILKMSDFPKGDWCPVWDALYWRFIEKHRRFFQSNPRLSMMTGHLDRMGSKLQDHQRTADAFLERLHR